MKKRLLALLLALIFVLGMLSGCAKDDAPDASGDAPADDSAADAPAADGEVKNKLAVIAPLTGNMMQYGIAYKTAITMFVEQFNEAGGLNGVEVEVEFYDDKGDQKESINCANMVVDDDQVFGCIGSFGSALSMAIVPVFDEAGITIICPDVSNPDFPSMSNYALSMGPVQSLQITDTTNLIYNDFDNPKLAIIYPTNDNGVYMSGIMEEVYTELGGELVCSETYVPYETDDFSPLLSKCKEMGAEVIYLDGEYVDIANILIQAQQLGMTDVQFVGPGQPLCQEFLDITGDASEGFIACCTTPAYSDEILANGGYTEPMLQFYNDYVERWPDETINGFCASSYNSANVLLNAVKNVGSDDPDVLADEVRSLPVESVDSFGWYFEGNEIQKSVLRFQVVDGTFVGYTPEKYQPEI